MDESQACGHRTLPRRKTSSFSALINRIMGEKTRLARQVKHEIRQRGFIAIPRPTREYPGNRNTHHARPRCEGPPRGGHVIRRSIRYPAVERMSVTF